MFDATSITPFKEAYLLGKEVVKETATQALSLIPSIMVTLSQNSTLNTTVNALVSSLAITTGIKNLYHLSSNTTANTSELHKIAKSITDIGVGALLLSETIYPQSLQAKTLVDHYYLINAIFCSCLAIRHSFSFRKKNRKDLAKAIVNTARAALQIKAWKESYLRDYKVFRKNKSADSWQLNSTICEHVFDSISEKAPQDIFFDHSVLYPFDKEGICSAMALDFMANYNTHCSRAVASEKLECIKKFIPYYISSTTRFSSIQAAFNTIAIGCVESLSPRVNSSNGWLFGKEVLAYQKIQSLANYYSLSLTPVTESFDTSKSILLKKILRDISSNSYIVRMIDPSSNHKLEKNGHTLCFVKYEESFLYYDNAYGLAHFVENAVDKVAEQITARFERNFLPIIRIYQAKCSSKGCDNFSAAENN